MSGMDFVTVMVLAFAIFLALAGIFTAWFGNGKSRIAGAVMIVIGAVVGVLWALLCGAFNVMDPVIDVNVADVFINALINFAGVIVGALVAIGIFLVVVLKS
jgi:hypothetical protein